MLKKTNKKDIEKQKIIFQFSLVLVLSYIAGVIVVKFVSEDLLIHILGDIGDRTSIGADFTSILLDRCADDIFAIITLWFFSFSYINYLVTDFVLVYWGFKSGFSTYLFVLSNTETVRSCIYIFITIALLAVYLTFSCSIAIKSLDLVTHRVNGRVSFNKRCLFAITVLSISTVGATLILNAIRLII